jgi:hypothetical protein
VELITEKWDVYTKLWNMKMEVLSKGPSLNYLETKKEHVSSRGRGLKFSR